MHAASEDTILHTALAEGDTTRSKLVQSQQPAEYVRGNRYRAGLAVCNHKIERLGAAELSDMTATGALCVHGWPSMLYWAGWF